MHSSTEQINLKALRQQNHGLSLQVRSLKASNRQLREEMAKVLAFARTNGMAIPSEVTELVEGHLIA